MSLFASKAELEQLRSELTGVTGKITEITAERDGLASQIESLAAERDALKGTVTGLNEKVASLTNALTEANAKAEASAKAEKEAKEALKAEQDGAEAKIGEEVNKRVAASVTESGVRENKVPPAAGTGRPEPKNEHPADAIIGHWSAESRELMGIN